MRFLKLRSRAVPARLLLSVLLLALAALLAPAAHAQTPAAAPGDSVSPPARANPDLHHIDLVPAPDYRQASGSVELTPSSSPFGAAVSADGRAAYDVVVTADDLPDPATLGSYTTFVAWVTTPVFDPMIRLGELRPSDEGSDGGAAGRTAEGRVTLDKFVVLVTAEASAEVTERSGPLVLRGTSPSMRMQPEHLPFLVAGDRTVDAPADHRTDHAHAESSWPMPPPHPAITMLPAMMDPRPHATPFLPADAADYPIREARPREVVQLPDGGTLDLEAVKVRRTLKGDTFVMYGFNGQYPGPLIQVDEGTTIFVNFTNRIELPTAVHWHGVRLENRFDGVPHLTQEPVQPGESFRYRIHFPDAGIYWYHPHHREDVQQDLGLYGNLLVDPPEHAPHNPANREEVLMLDDLLIGESGLIPYGRERSTHALSGRFGDVFLVNGEPEYRRRVNRDDVVRYFLTNASNTRTFNLTFGGARVKVVGTDVSRFEREEWVENVVIAPAERYVVEVLYDEPGEAAIVNRVRGIDHLYGSYFAEVDTLGIVDVGGERGTADHTAEFERLRTYDDVAEEIDFYRRHFDRPVDYSLVLDLEMREDLPFPFAPIMRSDSAFFAPVEWTGTMPMMNWVSTSREVKWILRDPATGRENMEIDWEFEVGDVVRIRLTNEREVLHAMQHPIHIHGQRFLVISRNGEPTRNHAWKDTMLLPAGETADILLELSNPGEWMLHCHIAEHLEVGMKAVFSVEAGERRGADRLHRALDIP